MSTARSAFFFFLLKPAGEVKNLWVKIRWPRVALASQTASHLTCETLLSLWKRVDDQQKSGEELSERAINYFQKATDRFWEKKTRQAAEQRACVWQFEKDLFP